MKLPRCLKIPGGFYYSPRFPRWFYRELLPVLLAPTITAALLRVCSECGIFPFFPMQLRGSYSRIYWLPTGPSARNYFWNGDLHRLVELAAWLSDTRRRDRQPCDPAEDRGKQTSRHGRLVIMFWVLRRSGAPDLAQFGDGPSDSGCITRQLFAFGLNR